MIFKTIPIVTSPGELKFGLFHTRSPRRINIKIPCILEKLTFPKGYRAYAISPIAPALMALRSVEKSLDCLILGINGLRMRTNRNDGRKIPIDATTAPHGPFNKYPMKVDVDRTGPGVN